MNTVDGYETLESPPESVTVTPEEPAGPVSLIVPVTVPPPISDVGLKLKVDTTPAGFSIKVADLVAEFKLAESGSEVLTTTNEELIVNVAEVAPAATVTVVE
jgi:hypothetical protein